MSLHSIRLLTLSLFRGRHDALSSSIRPRCSPLAGLATSSSSPGSSMGIAGTASSPSSCSTSAGRNGIGIRGSSSSSTNYGPCLLLATAAAAQLQGQQQTRCEEPSPSSKDTPLWPDGVSERDIDALVDEILSDATINLSLVPDFVEAKIYKSTIQLTLNTFYSMLSSLDGMPFLAHKVHLTRRNTTCTTTMALAATSSNSNNLHDNDGGDHKQASFHKKVVARSKMVDDEILEQVADRLLANPTINVKTIPDAIERQLYINCLKVIFRVLMVIVNSFSITICGHDVRLALEPSSLEASALKVASRPVSARSSVSPIDMELLLDFASDSGVAPTEDDGWSWWDRWNLRNEFMTQLHASLYGLMLGIVDDIMANTNIKILSEEIDMDMVPAKPVPKTQSDHENASADERKDGRSVSVGSFAAASFAAGVGIGVAGMALLSSQQR